MIKPSKLFLIRHAPVKQITGFFSQHNPDAIIKNNKIKKLATFLPDNCDWYVSPLKRTIQTAEALSRYKQYSKIIIENNIVEQNFGDWSGKKISEISHAYGMNVLVHSASLSDTEQKKYKVEKVSFEEILLHSDIISFHNIVSDK